MQYSDLYKLKFSPTIDLPTILQMIHQSPTDWLLLADDTYQLLSNDQQALQFPIDNTRAVFVPQILPYSSMVDGPYGRRINHISLQANLKTQPVMTSVHVRPDFIPFAMVINKWTLLRLLNKCHSSSGLFLELSLLIADPIYIPQVQQDWTATVKLREIAAADRWQLLYKYFPAGKDYLLSVEQPDISMSSRRVMVNNVHHCRDGFVKFFNAVHGRRVLLTQQATTEYRSLQYDNTTISLDPSVDADYYIALPGAILSMFDMHRTITQIVLPDHNNINPIYTPDLLPLGAFAVKQFTSVVHFAPPFSASSSNLLTAVEIIMSCAPKSILIDDDTVLSHLMAADSGAESIKRQVFMTRIIEHATNNNIGLKVLGDLCRTM